MDSGICLNPFDLKTGEAKPDSAKIQFILSLLQTIFKEDDQKGLPKEDKALLEKCIYEVYTKTKDRAPYLSDFKKVLDEQNSEKLKKYSNILFSWCGKTPFGKFLDGPSNINLEKNIISFETRGLTDFPELNAVFMLIITDTIVRAASEDPLQPCLIIIDEGWILVKAAKEWILYCNKVGRKFRFGLWFISQSLTDLQDIADAVLQNTSTRIILRQRGVNWEQFQKTMQLNDADIQALKSLKQVKGQYSEFFLAQEDNKAIVRMEVDRLSYWLTTTDPSDREKIAKVRLEHPELTEIQIRKRLAESES